MSGANPTPDALTKAIADQLAARYEALKADGATQRKIGDAAGISQGQMSRILRGDRGAHIMHYEALCHALGLNLNEVLDRAREMVRDGVVVAPAPPARGEKRPDTSVAARPAHGRTRSRAAGATHTRQTHKK